VSGCKKQKPREERRASGDIGSVVEDRVAEKDEMGHGSDYEDPVIGGCCSSSFSAMCRDIKKRPVVKQGAGIEGFSNQAA